MVDLEKTYKREATLALLYAVHFCHPTNQEVGETVLSLPGPGPKVLKSSNIHKLMETGMSLEQGVMKSVKLKKMAA